VQASQGKLEASRQTFGKLAFEQAAAIYFVSRQVELSESSQKKERQLLVKPCEFFRTTRLTKIVADDIFKFREWRMSSGVGPAAINMEIGVIRRILKRAKRWHLLSADIHPLKEPRSVGRALTYEEKVKLLHVAGQNEEWQRAEAAMSIALNTTIRGCEITRAVQCPNCRRFQKPGRQCSDKVCGADIHSLKSSLAGLRFHDLRHHAITELAESQVSDQTIMAIAGHVSQRMLARYSHVRSEARKKAVAALSAKPTGRWFQGDMDTGYDTTNDTIDVVGNGQQPEVIEINGRLVGTRTPDLHRVKVAL
jgi:hypothetical protein